ncbi:protocadherin-8-like isoform X1 [Pimephales promelas]|uniref:protocadherin-8-like isoform X1 n=1 Tax=Pimephales promelas TaxID=90988 RepID=UPI001955AB8D|nr:protocadherin-8-like isoform X1 [Pimephales promelas]KAG1956931.1 protocadherin-8 [Pimephales promelas]
MMGGTPSSRVLCHWWTVVAFVVPFLSTLSVGMVMKYQTYEEDALFTVIGNLAKDMSLNPSDDAKTNFKMMKQFNASFIRLREKDGQLTVGERIDREKICKNVVQCLVAFDVVSLLNEQFKLIHIEVEVKDINDHAPEFSRKESTLEISENTAVGTRISLDVALDEDVGSNYIQSYQLSVNSHFTIDVLSRADGVKYAELVLMKELDRETHASYVLELVATDGGNPSRSGTTNINVKVKDFNDNSPVFDRNNFSVDILEDLPVGFLLLDLNAVDPDDGLNGEVVYGFGNQVPLEIRQHFNIDRKSGQLTLQSPIDFESKKTYEFDIQASDLGPNPSPSICKVVVHVQDVNDNAPEITITPLHYITITSVTAEIAYITEDVAEESFVALISTADRDSDANGQIHCALYGHNNFKLQRAYEDSFMIVTTSPLDREKTAEYNLTVVAEDLGSPPLRTIKQYTIRLSDENDNAPVFSKPVYEVSLVENNAPGAYITTVVARDPDLGENSEISYKLLDTYVIGSPVSTFVSLDPTTGSLYALKSFNYEVLKRLQLRIQASDGGSPPLQGSAIINLKIVDQNDNAPSITQPVLTNSSAEVLLPKNAPSGYVITQIHAKDADEGVNAELSFRISEGVSSVFSINSATGEIYLNRELNYKVYENLRITVSVSDNGRPSLTTVVSIDIKIIAGSLPSDRNIFRQITDEKIIEGDHSLVIIVVLAGSCTLLLLAIILIATSCNKRKGNNRGDSHSGNEDRVKADHNDPLIPIHSGIGFDIQPYSKMPTFSGFIQTGIDISCSSEDGRPTCVFDLKDKSHRVKSEDYSTLPGYGKDALRLTKIWKSTSTISAQDPQFSRKDSYNGESDFNDSDSETSGDGPRKYNHQNNVQNGLWACTSKCKVLGHSDDCWCPTAAMTNSNLAHSFAKMGILQRDTQRMENYQAHIPKTKGLQNVCEKVMQREYDYITIVNSPQQVRVHEMNNITIPVYSPTETHCSIHEV